MKIKDVFFVTLRSWRQMIVYSLAGVLLLVGVALFYGRAPSESTKQAVSLTDKEIEEISKNTVNSDPTVIEIMNRIESLESQSRYLSDRLVNSIYLAIDEMAQPKVAFNVIVTPEEPAPTSEETYEQRTYSLSLGFLKQAKSDKFAEYLADRIMHGVEAKWVKELLTAYLDDEQVLHFEVVAPDQETVDRLAEDAQGYFTDIIREHLDVNYLFEVEIMERTASFEPNPLIKSERERLEKEFNEVRLMIDQHQEAIDLKVKKALEQALEKQTVQLSEEIVEKKVNLRRKIIRFGGAGAVVGILITSFFAVFRATSPAVVWSPEELADQLGLLYIGSVALPNLSDRKRFGAGFDRWLENTFYREKKTNEEENLDYLASVIEGLDKNLKPESYPNRPYHIAIMGEAEGSTCENLVNALQGLGSVQSVGVIADTVEGIKVLQSSDAVVQLVQARRTDLRKTIRNLELAAGMGVKLLGIIGVG